MILDFDPDRYPRTMSREDWIKAYRWVRKTRKELASRDQQLMAAALLCGDERMRREAFNSLVYPPVMMVPDLELNHPIDIRPGAINYITHKPKRSFREWLHRQPS